MLRDALLESPGSRDDKEVKRMREMYELIELSSSWFDDVQRLSPETLVSLMKMAPRSRSCSMCATSSRAPPGKSVQSATPCAMAPPDPACRWASRSPCCWSSRSP
jgi:hypothetical protein